MSVTMKTMAAANSKDKIYSFLKMRWMKTYLNILFLICSISIAGYVCIRYGEILSICEEEHLSKTSPIVSPFPFMERFYQLLHWFKFNEVKADEMIETSTLCSETWFYVFYVIFTDKFLEDACNVVHYVIKTFKNAFHFFFIYSKTIFGQIQISLLFSAYSSSIIIFALIITVIVFISAILWKLMSLERNSLLKSTVKSRVNESPDRDSSKQLHSWSHKSYDSLQLTPVASNGTQARTSSYVCSSQRPSLGCFYLMQWIFLLILIAVILSIPWEFLRLYQKAVASHAAQVVKGLPSQCLQTSMGWLESFQFLLRWHFSWSHNHDVCQDYYYASLVDPLWEVNPLMVLSSVFTHGLLHPLEIASSSLGRSMRAFFSEIPTQWQPLIMLVAIVMSTILLLMTCRYRLLIPLFLRIEPQTPVTSPAERERSRRERAARYRDSLECNDLALKYEPGYSYVGKSPFEDRNLSQRVHQKVPTSQQATFTSNCSVSNSGGLKDFASNSKTSSLGMKSSADVSQRNGISSRQTYISDRDIRNNCKSGDRDYDTEKSKESQGLAKKSRKSRKKIDKMKLK